MIAPRRDPDGKRRLAIVPFPEDRLPPQNLAMEQGVLGLLMIDAAAIDEVAATLKPDDFWRDDHQAIARVIWDQHTAGKSFDGLSVEEELRRRGELERIGGFDVILALAGQASLACNAAYHADVLRQIAVKRAGISVGRRMIESGYSHEVTADEFLATAETELLGLNERRAIGETRSMFDLAREAMARIERRRQGEVQGVSTGLADLDEITDGLAPEQLIVIGARPGMGKSSLALNFAEHATLELGGSVLFVTLEMGGLELAERTIASRSKVAGHRLRCGAIGHREQAQLDPAIAGLEGVRLFVDATPGRTVSDILGNARRIKRRVGLDMLVVDYLQLVTTPDSRESRQEKVADISRRLKLAAKELKIPIIAVSQLNRNCEGREGRRPMLSDLRESGAVEQDADVVILLHRPDYYDPNDTPGVSELIVAKNRNGETKVVKATFLKEIMRFENLAIPMNPIDGGDF